MTGVAIRATDIAKRFGKITALDHATFEVPRGIVFGFLGPNGAGKTTVIRTLLGLLRLDGGEAQVLGFDVASQSDSIRERTGALLEHDGLYKRLTAEQNLDFWGRVWRISRAERRRRMETLLTRLGLWERRKDAVAEWSRGMKQKLAVARTLLHRPELVFLDEPTAGLDPVAAAALRDDLEHLASEEGVTVFLTTHNLAEAERLCDRIGIINKGRVVALGTPAELRDAVGTASIIIRGPSITPAHVAMLRTRAGIVNLTLLENGVQLVLAPNATVTPLVRALIEHGAEIEEVRRERPTLERTFLDLIADDGQAGAAT
ncbi:MAG: ATP-binding cassette domain-containing protein [Gemmatimonadaceae bacterium]